MRDPLCQLCIIITIYLFRHTAPDLAQISVLTVKVAKDASFGHPPRLHYQHTYQKTIMTYFPELSLYCQTGFQGGGGELRNL